MTDTESSQHAESLRAELRAARERIDLVVTDLRAVDSELDALDTERKRFELVRQACVALESLSEMGGGALFWGGSPLANAEEAHLRSVRGRLDGFDKRIAEIEERRQVLLDEIEILQEEADFIAGDVLEADRQEEQKKYEWQIDRELDSIPIRVSVMPWARGGEDDRRLRKALAIALLLSLTFGLLLPLIDLPLPERWEVLEEQERLTQLIREVRPEPPVVISEPKPIVPEETEPQEPVQEEALAEESAPTPEPAPAAKKAKPASQGILAFREQLSGISQSNAVARLGSNARLQDGGDAAAGLPERSMVTTQAPGSSGGINVAALSRSTGGSGEGLGGVAVAQATSTIGGGGGSGRPLAGGGGAGLSRTDEEIQIVFDRHKAALYRLYNRALRKNPTLKGQIVLKLTIEPDGSVSFCAVKSSDMNAPELSKRVVERVETFDFGAKEGIPALTIVYPIDFLPAT